MPKCKINGTEIEVKEGSSIIEAYKKVNEEIAHYCWHPGLSVAGVCRLCMVSIEGNPRMQIACNTKVQEGMVINNQSEEVKDAVQWGLSFHLINHPLDCPICDQAGECGLQDQYMKFGQYVPEMAEKKVKKHKAVDLGPTIVLDSERCILCSRCVRFTEEVTKTHELGIFNRGDHSEVGTFNNKPLDNDYSLNTVDICPVGALTSKDFRFQQRVWYLKEAPSICTLCSTGCNVNVYHNEEGLFRVKPIPNPEVNGYWMCDQGRDLHKIVNKPHRLEKAKLSLGNGQWEEREAGAVVKEVSKELLGLIEAEGADSVALVLTGQYSCEEYKSVLDLYAGKFKTNQVYHWVDAAMNESDFDGLLIRGDKNPNTKGLRLALEERNLKASWQDLEDNIRSKKIKMLVVAGPENQEVYSDISAKVQSFSQVEKLVWLSSGKVTALDKCNGSVWQIPMKTFFEKTGSFMNYSGRVQEFKKGGTIVSGALTLEEVAGLLEGGEVSFDEPWLVTTPVKVNYMSKKPQGRSMV